MDECPVEAIYPDMDVPDELQEWIELNEKAEEFPQIVSQKEAPKGPNVQILKQINKTSPDTFGQRKLYKSFYCKIY